MKLIRMNFFHYSSTPLQAEDLLVKEHLINWDGSLGLFNEFLAVDSQSSDTNRGVNVTFAHNTPE